MPYGQSPYPLQDAQHQALPAQFASMQLGAGSATVGIGSLFLTIAAVVIGGTALSGGKGGILRSALGVLLLTTLNNGLILSGVSPNIQSGVSGAILVAAIAVLLVSNRLRIPSVVGFLLTGVLIGPSGLGLVSTTERVEIFAEIGVVFLLFAIGLEFSLASAPW